MRPAPRLIPALVVASAALISGVAAASPAPSAHSHPSAAAARDGGVTAAKRRHHRRPGCGKFCRQAGGFGGGPGGKLPVKVLSKRVRVDRDGIVGIRARCTISETCDGAILVDGRIEYGRSNLRIGAHRTRTVHVFVTAAGRRNLREHGRDKRTFATIPLKDENQPVSFSHRFTLLPHH